MAPPISRLLVALVGLPLVLLIVWAGGWWLFALTAVAAVLALHEYALMIRSLRPVILAAYAGALLSLLGARLGGIDWTMAGLLATIGLAFLLHWIAETRQSATVAIASTVLGAAWIGLCLAHLLLIRGIPHDGRLAAFTVLLAVWAGDIGAFFAGRLIGRHKLAPALSPGKTWEGFLFGTAATVFVAFVALYRQGYLSIWESIGRQALEIIDGHPELELCAAASGAQPIDGLAPLTQVGGDLTELLERAEPDLVLNAVVGFAGLPATLWALERGVDLALANKESLVAAGELALDAHRRGGGRLLPVDSEHSAAFQCLEGRPADQVHSLVLTASGGPFRGRTREQLEDVRPADALAHPTWNMGPKITVDSATLANKGLELIEAHFLFGLAYDRIEVVVHPSSLVHAVVRFRDGGALAHVGYPDMRVPISYALTYPDRAATSLPGLDLAAGLTLEFHAPDLDTFPLLAHARRAGEEGGTYPCAFHAANEVAVAAFLDGRLPFLGIADVVADALDVADGFPARDFDELVAADAAARRHASKALTLA